MDNLESADMAQLKDDEVVDAMSHVSLKALDSGMKSSPDEVQQTQKLPQVSGPEKTTKSTKSSKSGKDKKEEKKSSLSSISLDYLYEQGYTKGLVKSLEKSKLEFPVRIWLVDNTSPDLRKRDGHMISELSGRKNVQLVPCSRIEEMEQTVDYHEQMANIIKSPTIIKTINRSIRPQDDHRRSVQQDAAADDTIVITSYEANDMITRKLEDLTVSQMNSSDAPRTLNQCLREMHDNIQEILPLLKTDEANPEATRRIVLVIATDGKPIDESGNRTEASLTEFATTLSTFRTLPVWIVIRLCTDDEKVINFWNSLDPDSVPTGIPPNPPASLARKISGGATRQAPKASTSPVEEQQQQTAAFDMEVLDDFVSEGQQVYAVNRWLNYALPLHRVREMGFHDDVFDVLDERTLNKEEIVRFVTVLFGTSCMKKAPPHRPTAATSTTNTDEPSTAQSAALSAPSENNEVWLRFCGFLNDVCVKEKMQWNPNTQSVQPWLDVEYLKKMFDDTSNEPKAMVAKRRKNWLGKLVPRGFSFRTKK